MGGLRLGLIVGKVHGIVVVVGLKLRLAVGNRANRREIGNIIGTVGLGRLRLGTGNFVGGVELGYLYLFRMGQF
jgi:hypothetical protein